MNRLQHETSPYLKRHEHNPVDWYPWGEEALRRAKEEDKPILVSIGYSACHWCHVMAHECFENEQLAAIMNGHFINIKVDREERPDVDSIYMDALHAMGLRGGWPLNVFLMPDAKPFYGGTYFPPQNWRNILLGIQNAFVNDRQKLQESADSFAQSLNTRDSDRLALFDLQAGNTSGWSETELQEMIENLSQNFDTENGGMQRAPKFPMPSIWKFLRDFLNQQANSSLQKQLLLTLDRIALGGIYDHTGGGWTRYSTDADWKVPHFEKMLYDNGQLLELYSEAIGYLRYQQVGEENSEIYQWASEKTVGWLQREMTSESGAFYAALDADSEGEEGKYYLWTKSELEKYASDDLLQLYRISEAGNWEHGNNVLHLETIPPKDLWQKTHGLHESLLQVSKGRVRPGLDDKLLCNWNALAISGLCAWYQVSGDEKALQMAERVAKFIYNQLSEGVGEGDEKGLALWHMFTGDITKAPLGFLDDYASSIQAFIDLYQANFDISWLNLAEMLLKYVRANFYDQAEGLFYFTDIQAEKLIARKKEIYDNVIPASNSMLAHGLFDLGVLTGNDAYIDLAADMFGRVRKLVIADPGYMANWASLGLKLQGNLPEVVISGQDARSFRKEFTGKPLPQVYFAGSENESALPLFEGRWQQGKTRIYVCQNKVCKLPADTVDEAIRQLYDL